MKYIEKTAFEKFPKRIARSNEEEFIDLNQHLRLEFIEKIKIELIYLPLGKLIELDVESYLIDRKLKMIERKLEKIKNIYSRLSYGAERKYDKADFYSEIEDIKKELTADD